MTELKLTQGIVTLLLLIVGALLGFAGGLVFAILIEEPTFSVFVFFLGPVIVVGTLVWLLLVGAGKVPRGARPSKRVSMAVLAGNLVGMSPWILSGFSIQTVVGPA